MYQGKTSWRIKPQAFKKQLKFSNCSQSVLFSFLYIIFYFITKIGEQVVLVGCGQAGRQLNSLDSVIFQQSVFRRKFKILKQESKSRLEEMVWTWKNSFSKSSQIQIFIFCFVKKKLEKFIAVHFVRKANLVFWNSGKRQRPPNLKSGM